MTEFLFIDLQTWWFLVIGAIFTGYTVLDGFDLGAGALHLFFKKEESRRIALNAIGPVWDGNEVWLVIGGGALFAGFPEVYATLLSAFYIPIILFLTVLILRAVAIEFRSKEPMAWWRQLWDFVYSGSSVLIAFLLGVVLGNVIQGLPLDADFEYQGTLTMLINPYALLTGATTVALFAMHGSIYLVMKTEHRLYTKLSIMVRNTSRIFVVLYMMLTMATLVYFPKMASAFKTNPLLFGVPLFTILLIINTRRLLEKGKYLIAFICSGLTVASLLLTVALNLYPNILVSTLHPANSISIYNGASSLPSLRIILGFALVGVPIVATYTVFVFWTFKGKVKMDETSY